MKLYIVDGRIYGRELSEKYAESVLAPPEEIEIEPETGWAGYFESPVEDIDDAS